MVFVSVVNFIPTFECLKLLFCHLMMDQSATALFISVWYNLESVGSQRRNDNLLGSQNWNKIESRRSTVDMNAHCLLHAVIKRGITNYLKENIQPEAQRFTQTEDSSSHHRIFTGACKIVSFSSSYRMKCIFIRSTWF